MTGQTIQVMTYRNEQDGVIEAEIHVAPDVTYSGRVQLHMSPIYAAALADALESLPEPEPRNHWREEIEALYRAAKTKGA
jgi:hypothetical protein